MLLDRDLFNQVFFSLDKFEAEGLPTNSRWHTFISPGFEKFWLDPKRAGDFGQGAELYQHKPTEAKKLLLAAGIKTPVEAKFISTFNGYGDAFVKQGEILHGMLEADGFFKLDQQSLDFNSQFRFGYYWSKAGGGASNGEQDGLVHLIGAPTPYLDAFLYSSYHSKGSRVKIPFVDPIVDDLVMKQRAAVHEQERARQIQELQRHLTKKMYSVPNGGLNLGFELGWPWISNQGVYSSWSSPAQEANTYLWYDASKKASQ
jgi:ABC-type transport system substrate-binding protein